MENRIDPRVAQALVPPALAAIIPEGILAVGGSPRDIVMGRVPNDIDLCTPLLPEEVMARAKAVGYRVIPTGLQHGTVTVMLGEEPHEITTFRTDVETDGRHAVVEFTPSLEEDLARRDFTINAMAVDIYGELHDPFGGYEDIQQKVIRCVGNPEDRFREDLLRIIRAARFASTLGFDIDPETREAMRSMAPELQQEIGGKVSVNRVVQETEKAFKGDKPSTYLQTLWDLGVIQTIIPEMANADDLAQDPQYHPEGSVWQHILQTVDRADANHRWNALFHDIGKCLTATPTPEGHNSFRGHDEAGAGIIEDIGRRMNMSTDLIESIQATTEMHMQPLNVGDRPSERTIRRLQHRAGPHLSTLEGVVRADSGERYNPGWDSLWAAREQQNDIAPILMGRHLLERGHRPGPEMGQIVKRAHEHQLDTGETDIDRLYDAAMGKPSNTATIAHNTVVLAVTLDRKRVYDLADRLEDVAWKILD